MKDHEWAQFPGRTKMDLAAWRREFDRQLDTTVDTICALLGEDIFFVKDAKTSPLPELFHGVQRSVRAGDRYAATCSALFIHKFAEDLVRIKSGRPDYFAEVAKRFSHISNSEFRGLRFEIGTASALIMMGIPFRVPRAVRSAPDFVVETEMGPVKIECTAPQVVLSAKRDLQYKIYALLGEKSRKDYADGDTVVMMEISHLVYSRIENSIIESPDFRDEVAKQVADLRIGGVILILYATTPIPDGASLGRHYFRHDSKSISKSLKQFLDHNYPKGQSALFTKYTVSIQP